MNTNILISEEIALAADSAGKHINAEDYRFLDDMAVKHKPVLIGFGGSVAYGTNIETSDTDIRGIAMNTVEEAILGKDFEQFTNVLPKNPDTDKINRFVTSVFTDMVIKNNYLSHKKR